MNGFRLAQVVGKKKYLHIGIAAIPELQLSYSVACLKRSSYDNSPESRLRRHLLLYWQRGRYKTSSIMYFLKACTPTRDLVESYEYTKKWPTFLLVDGIKKPILRGSAEGRTFIYPLVQEPTFIVSYELINFLGHSTEDFSENMNFFNTILEEGKGVSALIKMAKIELSDRLIEELEEKKIIYNPRLSMMTYDVDGTMMAASRPVGGKFQEILSRSGFFDRLNIIRPNLTDREWKQQRAFIIPSVIPETQKLQKLNIKLWNTIVHKVEMPPVNLIRPIKKELYERFEELEIELSLAEPLDSGRDDTNIASLLTAHAFMNMPDRIVTLNDEYEEIIYTEADMHFVMEYLNSYISTKLCFRKELSIEDQENLALFKKTVLACNNICDAKEAISIIQKLKTNISVSTARKILYEWSPKFNIVIRKKPGAKHNEKQVIFDRSLLVKEGEMDG